VGTELKEEQREKCLLERTGSQANKLTVTGENYIASYFILCTFNVI
jgi:hypothetical protein